MKLIMSKELKTWEVLLLLATVRIASVFLVQTWYVPDEYWQSTEVAHKAVFGYGYLTWEWTAGIRSYIHPGIISILYKLLSLLHLDYTCLIITAPRILQAILTAYSDYTFYQWSGKSKWALFSITTAWFWFYIGSRTLINSFETAITVIALSKYPWLPHTKDHNPNDSRTFIALIGLVCAMRPTAAIVWLPLCIYHIFTSRETIFRTILVQYLPIIGISLTISTVVDSYMHGSLIFTWYEFLKINVFEGISDFYGTNPWHWYLSQGFPAILGIQLIPFTLATIHILLNRQVYRNQLVLLFTITFTIAVYSLLAHKEFRFIAPVLPMAIFISSQYISVWSRKANDTLVWLFATILLTGNLLPAYYLGLIHQRGTLDVMPYLSNISSSSSHTSLLFLMPCHSTPLYSHLHHNVTTRHLTCNPNLNHVPGYVTEVDAFYGNPSAWLVNNYPKRDGEMTGLPSHVVVFDSLVPYLDELLNR